MINIDDRILDQYDEKEMYLLLWIAKRMRANKTAWPSMKTLSKDTGWSKNTIIKVRKRLEEKGALLVDKRERDNGSFTSNEYEVIADGIGIYCPLNSIRGGSKNELGVVQKMNQQGVQKMNHKEKVKKKEKDNAQIKDVEQVTPEWELRFNEFWSRCWRKVGKKRAKTAFKRLSKKDQLACMAEQTISEYLNYLRATGYDAMHPTTWINGRRWEDDFSAPASANGANTDEALNDRLLPEPLDTDYRRYIAYVIDTFPALWKSKCQVLSKSQWYDLTQTEVFQNLRIAMTPRKARQIRADLHSLFNQNAIERSKYATMYDAVKAEYLRHINHEKTLIA